MPDEPVKTEPTATVDKDALEIGELIKAAGFSKTDVNMLTESAVGLASIRNLIENNPLEFQNSLEKANPAAARKFEDAIAQRYVEKYATDDKEGKDDKDKDNPLAAELKLLKQKMQDSEGREATREQAAALAQVKARYDARIDDLFGQLPADLALTKSEKASLRAYLNTELAADPDALARAAKGNFVDVPKKFAEIIKGWTDDRKAATEAEATKRKDAERRAQFSWPNGAEAMISESDLQSVIEKDGADWDGTVNALANALNKTR